MQLIPGGNSILGISNNFYIFASIFHGLRLWRVTLIAYQAVVHMFEQLGFVRRWCISSNNLFRFVLTVRRNYRANAYHNWSHGFCVAHFAFLCFVNSQATLHNYLNDLEWLALFVGALCHDIDHPGSTNSYQVRLSLTWNLCLM